MQRLWGAEHRVKSEAEVREIRRERDCVGSVYCRGWVWTLVGAVPFSRGTPNFDAVGSRTLPRFGIRRAVAAAAVIAALID